MNFLAHIYLSGEAKDIVLGNFIGDFVKGNQINDYPIGIQEGIRMHRFIDEFTDSHPVVMESKKRLRSDFRHYSPVIVDVFYDHYLASLWPNYHHIPLILFTQKFYEMVNVNQNMLPPRAKHMFTYMSRDNWLYHYQYVEGINRALTGISQRTSFVSGMEKASTHLTTHYDEFKEEFTLFFPSLKQAVADGYK